jgi:hypothetical protein
MAVAVIIYGNYRRGFGKSVAFHHVNFAAAKMRANRGCNAALPETIRLKLPPSPSFHLLKINFLAIFSCHSYQHHWRRKVQI